MTKVPAPAPSVFISYRHQETSYLASWLYDRLAEHFGETRVFLDRDSIKPGTDWVVAIEEAVGVSGVLLVIVGPRWLAPDEHGRRRLYEPKDIVRLEIEAALSRSIAVIPVLVGGAKMPAPEDLPDSIAPFARRQAVELKPESSRSDVSRVLTRVEEVLGAAVPPNVSGPPHRTRADEEAVAGGPPGDPQQRARLLARLSHGYASYTEQSLEATVRVELGLDRVPAEVSRVWDRILPVQRGREPLDEGASLLEVFDEAGGLAGDGVLLLGEPGAGKTTLLVELAGQLADRARSDPHHPLPVYLPLSTWAVRRPPFEHWVVGELNEMHEVHHRLARRWLRPDHPQLLLLLDGLDELADPEARASCAKEINRFNRMYPLPVVVCSRRVEYDALDVALKLGTAVAVRPLDPETVLDYLMRAGDRMQRVVTVLQRDPELLDLLRSPLLVSMLTLAYADGTGARLPVGGGQEERRHRLIADYVDRRLELERQSRSASGHRRNLYPPECTLRWLSTLARGLTERQQTVFLLERVGSDWLALRWTRHLVVCAPKLVFGLVVGLVNFGEVWAMQRLEKVDSLPAFHLVVWTIFGLLAGPIEKLSITAASLAWAVYGLVAGLVFMLVVEQEGVIDALAEPLYFMLLFVLTGELVRRLLGGELQPAERLSWSWTRARPFVARALGVGILVGIPFGLAFGLSTPRTRDRLGLWVLVFGPVAGLLWGFSRGLVRGLSAAPIPVRTTPNEGIRRSARHGLLLGFAVMLVVALVFSLVALMFEARSSRLSVVLLGLLFGATFGWLWALASGLGAAVQHATLRLLMWRYGMAPLRYVRWLDYAVRLRLLYWGVGGGHVFIHRMVQEHLGATDDRPERDSSDVSPNARDGGSAASPSRTR
jgi:eukaryotic-like serine/threonine-protein kinase